MQVNKISLEERLDRLKNGNVGDPEFVISAIKSMANIPICVYMKSFEEEWVKLKLLLAMTPAESKSMTYREVAVRIYKLWLSDGNEKIVKELIGFLALPFKNCCEERKGAYGEGAKNTA